MNASDKLTWAGFISALIAMASGAGGLVWDSQMLALIALLLALAGFLLAIAAVATTGPS